MSWKREGRYEAEDTVPGFKKTRCINQGNKKRQCGLSSRAGQRKVISGFGVGESPSDCPGQQRLTGDGGRGSGPYYTQVVGQKMVRFLAEGVMAFQRSVHRLLWQSRGF